MLDEGRNKEWRLETVNGRPAHVAYIGADHTLVEPDKAVLIKVAFIDREGGVVSLRGPGEQTRAFDEGKHPRDEDGKWTSGGGSSGKLGPGYSSDAKLVNGVIHTSNVYDAQRALFENRKVELTQPKQISTLIKRLGETAAEMAEQGKAAPTFNLCLVSLKGTNLFCADQIGIPRVEMPVIRAGATKDFVKYLERQGYEVKKDKEEARNLRATQSEISGEKVAASMARIKKDGFYKRLVVSRDDYILDGHHTWAGQLGLDAKDNDLENDDREVKIFRVDISITKLVAEAEKWTGGKGKKPASEPAKALTEDQREEWRIAKIRATKIMKSSAHTDWMNECVPELMGYGKDQLNAIAACLNMWRQAWEETHPDGADDPGPSPPGVDGKQWQITVARARELVREWDESKHPRVPAGSPGGGQFGEGAGGATESEAPSKKPLKSKKPATRDDFAKAKIRFRMPDTMVEEFLSKWNDKIGIDPEEFEKTFTGGLQDQVEMSVGMSGNEFQVTGIIKNDLGATIGNFDRDIKPDKKEAYSAYFKLVRSATGGDTGKKILSGNIEAYQAMGIETVRVTANIDVGGYAWAKYGYVPTPAAWSSLSSELERKLDRLSGEGDSNQRGRGSDNTYEADSWEILSNDQQEETFRRWARDSRDEFLQSEIDNWRENGEALETAKRDIVDEWDRGRNDWALDALKELEADRKEEGGEPYPFNHEQVLDALSLTDYESNNRDGTDDPEWSWDDTSLNAEGAAKYAGQLELPGIDPPEYNKLLTPEMRTEIEERLTKAFNDKAESDQSDIDPPDYLSEQVEEYQGEYWDQKDDDEKLRHAIDYGQADIPVEEEEEEEDDQPEMDLTEEEKESPEIAELYDVVRSSNPKGIWKVADSSLGKQLLLNSGWAGVLSLTDKESVARFKAYVGRAKK